MPHDQTGQFKRIDAPGTAPAEPCVVVGVGIGRQAAGYEATKPLPGADSRLCIFFRNEHAPADAPPFLVALRRGEWELLLRLAEPAWAEADRATAAN